MFMFKHGLSINACIMRTNDECLIRQHKTDDGWVVCFL